MSFLRPGADAGYGAAGCQLAETGLQVTLRQYPGSVHLHLKRGRERGTLELTYWLATGRVWLSVHRNRVAPWITPTIETLQQQLQERFAED